MPGSDNDTDLQILELTTRHKDIEGKQDNFCEQFDDLTEELERMTEIYECINRTILRSKEETRNKFLFKQKTIQQNSQDLVHILLRFSRMKVICENKTRQIPMFVCFTKPMFDTTHFSHDFIYKDKNK